jgi:GNAT superfamily N-acetyltransferase
MIDEAARVSDRLRFADVGDVTRRPYATADASALAGLMNAVESHAGGRPAYTAAGLDGLVKALVADPATDSTLVFEGPDSLIAAAFTTTPPAGGFRVYLSGGVRPDRRGLGIGRDLLARQVDRAREIHAARSLGSGSPGAAWQAEARTPEGDRDAARLFRRLGLAPIRYWFEMTAGTANPPRVPVPDGLRVEWYRSDMADALYRAHQDAFAQNWSFQRRDAASWARLTVDAPSFAPELSFLAYGGTGVLAGYLLAYRESDAARAYVGQVGVLPSWRRRGLAGAMLARMLTAAGETGRSTVGLSVDAASPTGAVAVYERVGFRVESTAVTHGVSIGAGGEQG